MQPIPLLFAQAIRPLLDFRERVGGPLRQPPGLLRDEALLPLSRAGSMWEETSLAVGLESLGLRLGAVSRFENVPLGRHVRDSLTVGAGLDAAARAASRFSTGQSLWITLRGDDVLVRRRFSDALRRGRRQMNDFALQMLIDFLRRGAGARWRPAELHFEGPAPGHAEELAALAEGVVRFGAAADTVVFPHSLLALPLRPETGPVPRLPVELPASDFAGSIRQAIRTLLMLGELELPALSEAAGVSVRSLQRRLAVARLSYHGLVDETRFEAASRLLRDPSIRITDVSAELGYTDSANFTRAFRRWSGVPPLVFRRAFDALPGAVGAR